MRYAAVSILVSVFALTAGAPSAYADDPVTATILHVDDSAFPDVRAIVTVVDRGGRPVTDLQPADLVVEETGAPATVSKLETVQDRQIGLGVVLTLDTSGSMFGPKLAAAKSSASTFVRSLQPADQTAVLSFSSQVAVVDPLTANRDSALGALDRLVARGNTALYTAVAESAKAAREVPLPRKAVVFLSDGKEDSSQTGIGRAQALSLAVEGRVPFYIIGLGADIDREFLVELARQTGGAFLEAPSASDVAVLYDQLSQLLRSQYVVTLRSSSSAEIAERTLRLRLNSSAGATQARLDYQSKRSITPAPAGLPIAAGEPESGGSSGLMLALAGVLALAGLGAGAFFVYSRLRDQRLSGELAVRSTQAIGDLRPAVPVVPAAVSSDILIAVDGPDVSRTARIGRQPATIGSGESNQLRLEDDGGRIAEVHARVWSRDGKLIFHQLDTGHASLMAGKPVSWAALEAGDEVQIGPYKLRVQAT